MNRESYTPERGEVVWINFDPQAGREQSGRRPAVILSPKAYNSKVGLAILCPISNQAKAYPFEVSIPGSVSVRGVILSDQAKSVDWRERRAEFICKLPAYVVIEVLRKLNTLLKE